MFLAEILIKILRGYLLLGLMFAIPFIIFGVQRIDSGAKGLRIGFRLIIVPGVCLFWPLLALRWIGRKPQPVERNAHRLAANRSSTP